MASATLADIVAKVQNLINDSTPQVYTQTVLLPYINMAQDDLADELRNHGAGFARFVSSTLTVTAGTTALTQSSSPAIPTNLVDVVSIYERPAGGTEQDFVLVQGPMGFSALPNWNPQTTLAFFDIVQDTTNGPTIQFNPAGGATTNREIRIIYLGDVVPFASSGDKSMFYGAQNAISFRTAAYVALSRGAMQEAQTFNSEWTKAKDSYCMQAVKENQSRPVRRQPWLGIGRYLIRRY